MHILNTENTYISYRLLYGCIFHSAYKSIKSN
jgi:hypothetical protein